MPRRREKMEEVNTGVEKIKNEIHYDSSMVSAYPKDITLVIPSDEERSLIERVKGGTIEPSN